MTRLYLAGPMTGLPQFNFPAFHEAATALRAAGYDIVSPAETDPPEVQAAALASTTGTLDANGKVGGETWGQILARDVQMIADTLDGIVFLPNWHKSRGAKLEAFVALLSGKHQFGYYVEGAAADPVRWTSTDSVRQIIRECMP